jgi:hypothetical protein
MLTDVPAKSAVIIRPRASEPLPGGELGWPEGRERAKRKSQPPP